MQQKIGAGCLIGNADRSLFFVQEKDADYPIHPFQHSYSFWGGAVEPSDSSAEEALRRELAEELPNLPSSHELGFLKTYYDSNRWSDELSFFELILPNSVFDAWVKEAVVLEGIGHLVERGHLLDKTWALGFDFVIVDYLKGLKSSNF